MFNSSLMVKAGLPFIILATALPIYSPAYAGIIEVNYPNQNSFQETIRQQREKREQKRQAQADVRLLGLYDQAQLQQQLRQQQQELIASIPGIGALTAAKILAEIPQLKSFSSARPAAAFA